MKSLGSSRTYRQVSLCYLVPRLIHKHYSQTYLGSDFESIESKHRTRRFFGVWRGVLANTLAVFSSFQSLGEAFIARRNDSSGRVDVASLVSHPSPDFLGK